MAKFSATVTIGHQMKSISSCCHGLCEEDGGGWGLSIRSCKTGGSKFIDVSARPFVLNS